MKELEQAYHNIHTSPLYEAAVKQTAVIKDHFGVHHFWYYKITEEGRYSYFGSHKDWNRYCIENDLFRPALNIRPAATEMAGISFLKAESASRDQEILDTAWEKYRINFNLNITQRVKNGVESFGFATRFKDPLIDQMLINDLPLLRHFASQFRERNEPFFRLLDDNALDLNGLFGEKFTNRSKLKVPVGDRAELVRRLGFGDVCSLSLTPRELEVLKLLINGFSADYIGKDLHLSRKTVENYLAALKIKLDCDTKVELILKAKKMEIAGVFDR